MRGLTLVALSGPAFARPAPTRAAPDQHTTTADISRAGLHRRIHGGWVAMPQTAADIGLHDAHRAVAVKPLRSAGGGASRD